MIYMATTGDLDVDAILEIYATHPEEAPDPNESLRARKKRRTIAPLSCSRAIRPSPSAGSPRAALSRALRQIRAAKIRGHARPGRASARIRGCCPGGGCSQRAGTQISEYQ